MNLFSNLIKKAFGASAEHAAIVEAFAVIRPFLEQAGAKMGLPTATTDELIGEVENVIAEHVKGVTPAPPAKLA